MDIQDGIETRESRFATYVETLASALGHADRVAPLKAYCTGLLLPGDRKRVEPMAARLPARVQAAPSLCVTSWRKRIGQMMPCLASCRRRFWRHSSVRGRSAPGPSTTPAFPRRGSIRSCGPAVLRQLGKQNNRQVSAWERHDDRGDPSSDTAPRP